MLLLLLFLLLCGSAQDRIQSLSHSRQGLYDPATPPESFTQGSTTTLIFHHWRLYDHLWLVGVRMISWMYLWKFMAAHCLCNPEMISSLLKWWKLIKSHCFAHSPLAFRRQTLWYFSNMPELFSWMHFSTFLWWQACLLGLDVTPSNSTMALSSP